MKSKSVAQLHKELTDACVAGKFQDLIIGVRAIMVFFTPDTPQKTQEKLLNYIWHNFQEHIQEVYLTKQHTLKIYLHANKP